LLIYKKVKKINDKIMDKREKEKEKSQRGKKSEKR
jgi:hypothetical protein